MRLTHYLAALGLAAALPATAAAQQPAPAPPPPTPAPQATTSYNGPIGGRWTVSGFVGSNFNTSFSDIELNEGSSVAFGGQVSYLFGGTVGAEFVADFAPNFNTTSLAFADDPQVNSYMANVMAAVPLWGGELQPFFSGGVGGIQLRGDVLNVALNPSGGATEISRMKFGANVGGGLMAFAGSVGFRADIRFYHTSTDASLTSVGVADRLTETLLSGLKFWRANVGVAFQW
jgi:hypothetical protein